MSRGEFQLRMGLTQVRSTTTNDYTCEDVNLGDVRFYNWIVSSTADGRVNVSVQGETNFPDLEGRWISDSETLILEGDAGGLSPPNARSWFKLSFDDEKLQGVRRVVSGNQSQRGLACFADFEMVAERQ